MIDPATLSLWSWIATAVFLLIPAVWRLFTGNGRYLDALWCVALFVVANRLVLQATPEGALMYWTQWTAAILAPVYGLIVYRYQRDDR